MMTPARGAGHVVITPALPDEAAREGHLEDLLRLSDPSLSELRLEALLDEVLVRIREALRVDTVAILLHDEGTDELVARAARGLEAEVEAGVRIPLGRGFAGRIAQERRAITIPELANADVVNPILREMGLRSMLGVPLIVEATLIGVLHVGSLTPREFTPADAAVLELAAARVAPGIERARLFDALAQQRLAAEALQRGLLPDRVPALPDVHVAVRYVPARDEVGGDWYEVIPLSDGHAAVAIGDVVGHGVRAAALMAQVRAALRAYALLDPAPAAVLARLDSYLQHSHPNGMATVGYALLDTTTGVVRYASAGHPPPVIVRAGGARLLEADPAPPIGVQSFPRYEDTVLELATGDALLLYTDGLIERRGEPLGDGLGRLREAAEGDAHPEILCTRVLDQLIGPKAAEDDVALVAVQRTSPPPSLSLVLPAERGTLAPLRRRLGAWLDARGAAKDARTAIVLAVGEAAANAIEHAYAPGPATYEVEATATREGVLITVTDHGAWRERSRSVHRGRGLGIMRRSMDAVDIARTADGTRVTLRRGLGSEAS